MLANIGDSRAYLLRCRPAGRAVTVRITEDHTYRHLVSAASRVPNLPDKLARFLDGRPDGRSPDLTRLTLRPSDRLLLCTDGLSSYVGDDLIDRALAEHETAADAAGRLVQLAWTAARRTTSPCWCSTPDGWPRGRRVAARRPPGSVGPPCDAAWHDRRLRGRAVDLGRPSRG